MAAWLAVGLRAYALEDEALGVLSRAQEKPLSRAEVRDAQGLLRDARVLSADQQPLVTEAQLLVLAGRDVEAKEIAERVVTEEPDNLEAWTLLYAATVVRRSPAHDPKRAAQALRRIRELNPLVAERLRD